MEIYRIGTMVGHCHSGFKAESMVGYDGSVIADLIRNPEGGQTLYIILSKARNLHSQHRTTSSAK